MSEELASVAALVRERTGIALGDAQLPALAAALDRAAPGLAARSFLDAVQGPDGARLVDGLVDEVTVKETYFMREPRDLEALDWTALHRAAAARGAPAVRVWVAACATGEEAYTLAMLAREAFGGPPPVSILATDISPAALARAHAAGYSERSVRGLPEELRERYLVRGRQGHHVGEEITSLVRLRRHNLVADPAPPAGEDAFDVVACRNVLIYFDGPTVQRVLAGLEGAVAPGGQLVLGAADRVSGTAGRLGRLTFRRAAPGPARSRRTERALRRPRGVEAPAPAEDRIAAALRAADAGDLDGAVAIATTVIAAQPLHADAHFVHGLAELGRDAPGAAADAFRRALYADPSFGLAAFQLGRAHDALGDERAARRAYARALGALDPHDERHGLILGQVDLADVASACRARLTAAPAPR